MTDQLGGWVFFSWWEIPAFVHFALEAWILQAFSLPSSNTSESLKCYLCIFPFCLSKGKSKPLQTLWGREPPMSHLWHGKRPSILMLALQALALRRMSFPTTPAECHCCLVDFQMARLILKQQERIGPLGFQFSLGGGGIPFPSVTH